MTNIDVEPIREAFKASGMTSYRLHKLTGINKAGIGRILGNIPQSYVGQAGERVLQRTVSYSNALKMADALGMDRSSLKELPREKQNRKRIVRDPERKLRAEVDLRPIREAFERSELTGTQVARAMGFDKNYIYRLLGRQKFMKYQVLKSGERRRYAYYARSCNYETGVKFALALGVDPHEFGV